MSTNKIMYKNTVYSVSNLNDNKYLTIQRENEINTCIFCHFGIDEYKSLTKEDVLKRLHQRIEDDLNSFNWYTENKDEINRLRREEYQKGRNILLKQKGEGNSEDIDNEKKKIMIAFLKRKEDDCNRKKERVICECGQEISRGWLSNHKKTHKDVL